MWLYPPETPFESVSVETVGGKAIGLYWLRSRRFSVPPTWTLSVQAFDAVVEAAGIGGQIAALEEATADQPDWAGTERALHSLADVRGQVVEALQKAPLPAPIAEALEALPGGLWAVRSSATVEDGAAHSYAGQFHSALAVPAGPPRLQAIRDVWSSAFGPSVLHYRAQHRTAMPRMAVILQPMPPITADDRAGVVFSESTLAGQTGVVIQATFGVGLTIVGGGGGEVKCVHDSQVQTYRQPPTQILVTGQEGGVEPAPPRSDTVLSDVEALRLARQVREIARQYGRPVDVEFSWRARQEPMLVQVRALV